IMFGLRREVLEGQAPEPDEVVAGIEAVTAEDVQRVARDLISGDALRRAARRAGADTPRSPSARGGRPVRGRRPIRAAARLSQGAIGPIPRGRGRARDVSNPVSETGGEPFASRSV